MLLIYSGRTPQPRYRLPSLSCLISALPAWLTCKRNQAYPVGQMCVLGGESEVGATWPCLLGEFCKAVTFGGFNSNVAYHCFVWLAHSNMFHTCPKPSCLTGAIPLHRFQKTSCIFHGKRSTLETSIVILRGRRVVLRVFRIALSGLRQVVTTCKFRCRRGFL